MSDTSLLPPRLLTVREVASITGLSVSTLNKRRISSGGPRFVRLGRSVRYELSDVLDHVARNKFENTSQYEANQTAPTRGGAS